MLEAFAWYATVQLAALAIWPVAARAFGPLSDRGWTAAKTLGLLTLVWPVWLACMLSPLPFTRATLAVGLAAVAALAWLGPWRRVDGAAIRAWSRACSRPLLAWEALFLLLFGLFAVLRAHAPAIQGTEKPMDMAFLNGFATAERLPTDDTWLSGYGVPYYHFGYLIFASLTKLSGVPVGVGYNLAAATIPALAGVGLGGLAWNLARASRLTARVAASAACLALLLALGVGNLATPLELLVSRGWLTAAAGGALGIKRFADGVVPGVWPPPDGSWWFRASRIIPTTQPDGINEFPFFTAYLADLHPHFMALPFELLALTCAATHTVCRGATLRSPWTAAVTMLALGALLVINTWDIAPFWTLCCGLALLMAERLTWRALGAVALGPLGGVALMVPYFVGYGGPPLGLGLVSERTPLPSLLILFGPQLVLLALLGLLVRWWVGDRRGWLLVVGAVAVGLALGSQGEGSLGLLAALVLLLLPWPDPRRSLLPAEAMTLGIAWFAAAMLLGVELIFLDDVFHTRMNTVFKLHENVWLLAGLAAGVGVGLSLASRAARWARLGTGACAAAALALGLVYPLSAAATRLGESPPAGPALDGTTFLSQDDAGAIRWLRDQAGPARVVLVEAVGGEYSSGARVATFSGGATVIGWVGHELQWRGPLPALSQREADVERLYRETDPTVLRAMVARYGVQFVVVGDAERGQYGEQAETNVRAALPAAYRSGRTTVYRAR